MTAFKFKLEDRLRPEAANAERGGVFALARKRICVYPLCGLLGLVALDAACFDRARFCGVTAQPRFRRLGQPSTHPLVASSEANVTNASAYGLGKQLEKMDNGLNETHDVTQGNATVIESVPNALLDSLVGWLSGLDARAGDVDAHENGAASNSDPNEGFGGSFWVGRLREWLEIGRNDTGESNLTNNTLLTTALDALVEELQDINAESTGMNSSVNTTLFLEGLVAVIDSMDKFCGAANFGNSQRCDQIMEKLSSFYEEAWYHSRISTPDLFLRYFRNQANELNDHTVAIVGVHIHDRRGAFVVASDVLQNSPM